MVSTAEKRKLQNLASGILNSDEVDELLIEELSNFVNDEGELLDFPGFAEFVLLNELDQDASAASTAPKGGLARFAKTFR
jgi:hypothetical protein